MFIIKGGNKGERLVLKYGCTILFKSIPTGVLEFQEGPAPPVLNEEHLLRSTLHDKVHTSRPGPHPHTLPPTSASRHSTSLSASFASATSASREASACLGVWVWMCAEHRQGVRQKESLWTCPKFTPKHPTTITSPLQSSPF